MEMATAVYDLKELAHARATGKRLGIFSVCSAHPWVLEASMKRMATESGPLLIEATCNQVNQFGGYTNMTPIDFRRYVEGIAERVGFDTSRLILGGDHLGPYPWRNLPADEALANACDLVSEFVRAGFTKIHLDASMACADDPQPLPSKTIAQRAAMLARCAESASSGKSLRYVVGTEVPVPGGSVEELEVSVTKPADAEESLELHRQAFAAAGLDGAWTNVIALVTQPGVEFGHEDVVDYESSKAQSLSRILENHPEIIFEAHSTDYQKPRTFAELVEDGFSLLKVGPALTYAMRQGIFALLQIEKELLPVNRQSHLEEVLLIAMQQHPEHWKEHYLGTDQELHRMLIHSYSDRIRYYWTLPEVQSAVDRLISNLNSYSIPLTMLSDYLPKQYIAVREKRLTVHPIDLIQDKIIEALEPYVEACSTDR
jgi:D-tagatose-1,6-bisphosphate aldolase subunit GatZ/KbaZ